ncbi:hypothetical protein BP5796_12106 [Coleophoma crateriformis]|uniref:Phenylalanine ammonia-lyase n=1 Tax=Coleophoma crateriformis TaxID=565419 RepID=A0A3D8QBF8_9HELO|nr:hypothetical protein BP5796_12106 [Coleophoma crateriformis]
MSPIPTYLPITDATADLFDVKMDASNLSSRSHRRLVIDEWRTLVQIITERSPLVIDGNSVSVPGTVAVARYASDSSDNNRISTCYTLLCTYPPNLATALPQGSAMIITSGIGFKRVYRVTTGFGGSANTRTRETEDLQSALLQMQHSGVLPLDYKDKGPAYGSIFDSHLSNGDAYATLTIPDAWVRGTMLIRGNSLARAHSAVQINTIEALFQLLNQDLIPVVPLRGSISASGDLCPLSYIAGVLEGNPDIKVWSGPRTAPRTVAPRTVISAPIALDIAGIDPIVLGPKEGLALLNGTSLSASVAAMAIFEANNLAMLSQVLTAMGVEALSGTSESFEDFISDSRPHRGQKESAQNIKSFLIGSKLCRTSVNDSQLSGVQRGLFQDRYPLRTSPQWIGPQLEDLLLAHEQILVELNSTTDNPIVDVVGERVYHGGNFQAMSVTSAMEKVRQTLQHIGKMLFAQSTELMQPSLSNGLPPNLAADDPSLSYSMKGVDINMASYVSELGFLANPVSNHVQCAEMSNQAINSLAFIAARYTHTAIDLLSLISSAYLYCLCQALDLRVRQVLFLSKLTLLLRVISLELFPMFSQSGIDKLHQSIWLLVVTNLDSAATMDSSERFQYVMEQAQPAIIRTAIEEEVEISIGALSKWVKLATARSLSLYQVTCDDYSKSSDATPFLGKASKKLYEFVRRDLGVPFHKGLSDHPTHRIPPELDNKHAETKRTTGNRISVIYEALRSGRLYEVVIDCASGF